MAPSRMERAALSSPFLTAMAARIRAVRTDPGEAASSRSRNDEARGRSPRTSAARAKSARVSSSGWAGRTFSSAAAAGAGSSRVASATASRTSCVARESGASAARDEASCLARTTSPSAPRPASAAEALASSLTPSGSSDRRASPCRASCKAFWSEGRASWDRNWRPSAASLATAGSPFDRNAFQKKGPCRVNEPAVPTAATRTSAPATAPSATTRLRESGAAPTFLRKPTWMRGWNGTGTAPGPEVAVGIETSGASFIRLTAASKGAAAAMATHSFPPSEETSSFPLSSPFPSISTISRSEKGPKMRPDGRRTR